MNYLLFTRNDQIQELWNGQNHLYYKALSSFRNLVKLYNRLLFHCICILKFATTCLNVCFLENVEELMNHKKVYVDYKHVSQY